MKFFTSLFSTIGNSPVLKTLAAQIAGAAAVGIDTAIQNPTGGLAHTLTTNPTVAMYYVATAQFVHSFLSKYFPPAPAASVSTVAPAPAQK